MVMLFLSFPTYPSLSVHNTIHSSVDTIPPPKRMVSFFALKSHPPEDHTLHIKKKREKVSFAEEDTPINYFFRVNQPNQNESTIDAMQQVGRC